MSLKTAVARIFPFLLEQYRNYNQFCDSITTMHRFRLKTTSNLDDLFEYLEVENSALNILLRSELFSTGRILLQNRAQQSANVCPIFSNETHYYLDFVFSLRLSG